MCVIYMSLEDDAKIILTRNHTNHSLDSINRHCFMLQGSRRVDISGILPFILLDYYTNPAANHE
jgi:hypothetical protein